MSIESVGSTTRSPGIKERDPYGVPLARIRAIRDEIHGLTNNDNFLKIEKRYRTADVPVDCGEVQLGCFVTSETIHREKSPQELAAGYVSLIREKYPHLLAAAGSPLADLPDDPANKPASAADHIENIDLTTFGQVKQAIGW
jgi:hypothetical protein